jgi:ferritin
MLKKLIPSSTETLLQQAVQSELYASHFYKHLANQCQRLGLFGAASYFKQESADELEHYQKWADYLNDVGYVAELPEIDACDAKVNGLQAALEIAHTIEVGLMQKYAGWYDKVDVVTKQRMLEFIEIQRTSVGEYADLLARLDQGGDDKCAILLIDKELGK